MENSWAAPGVKCVCVEDREKLALTFYGALMPDGPKWPLVFMQTYTIKDLQMHPIAGLFLELMELPPNGKQFKYFSVNYFRPLETLDTKEEKKEVEPIS